jgi:hypothetical protein
VGGKHTSAARAFTPPPTSATPPHSAPHPPEHPPASPQ